MNKQKKNLFLKKNLLTVDLCYAILFYYENDHPYLVLIIIKYLKKLKSSPIVKKHNVYLH